MNTIEVHWEITNACNLRCKHCLIDAGQKLDDEMSTEECLAALEKMKNAGVNIISYTGGEPFCKRDFREIIEKTVNLGIQPQIITNGTLLTDDWIDFLIEHDVPIGVSLDGSNEITNDYIRGTGTFQKIMEFLQKARERGLSVSLYITATKYNMENLKELFKLADEFNCANVHVNELSIGGRHNSDADYALDDSSHYLIDTINEASSEVFGEELAGPDCSCWAGTSGIVLSSNGDLYYCTETKKENPYYCFGNIKTFPLKKWIEDNSFLNYLNCGCCYHVYYNSKLSVTKNEAVECALSEGGEQITTLNELYKAFDQVNRGCNLICADCEYPDCKGYIWLMNEEVDTLYESGVELLELNNNLHLLYSLKNEHGEPDLTMRQPPCTHRCSDGKCKIHSIRPLVCHMYPIGPETVDGSNVWALHSECQFTENMKQNNTLSEYIHRVKKIIDNISVDLTNEILEHYRIMDYLSTFPEGSNSCIIICEMKNG